MKKINKCDLAVNRNVLLFLAGSVWFCVGVMLLILAFSWLSAISYKIIYPVAGIGVLLALLIHHFGFLKIVDKNLERLLAMQGKQCLFVFIPLKSYLIIAVMVFLGSILRHSAIPKQYLAVLYISIGFALLLSSLRYLRFFVQEIISKNAYIRSN